MKDGRRNWKKFEENLMDVIIYGLCLFVVICIILFFKWLFGV